MNIHLLITDIWFYLTILLTVGYIILALLAYRFLKPFASMLRFMSHKPGQTNTTPAPYFSNSSLRSKLHGAKN